MADNNKTRYTDFDALAARHQRLIRSLCWWYAGGKADQVADLIQDVLLSLWHYRHTLRTGATAVQERAWVRLHCRSVFEHQRRRPQVETVPMEEALHVAADDTAARDTIDRLAADLSLLEHRVLELVLDGYTDGEIATAMKVSAAEARRMHAAVIEKMKQKAFEG
ncbi:MAG: sigma-70 family RNA polymerase sigma factor [Bacteroidales bacterium]|nr:sigma-70 family RNA polymerase sigma factor [Bacteroidales bacterium]